MNFFKKTVSYGTIAFTFTLFATFILLTKTIGEDVLMGAWIGGNMGTGMFHIPDLRDPPNVLFSTTAGLLAEYKTAPWAEAVKKTLGWTGMVLGGGIIAAVYATVFVAVVSILRKMFYGKMLSGVLRKYLLDTFICGFLFSASTGMFGLYGFNASTGSRLDPSFLLIPLVVLIWVAERQHVLNKRVTDQSI